MANRYEKLGIVAKDIEQLTKKTSKDLEGRPFTIEYKFMWRIDREHFNWDQIQRFNLRVGEEYFLIYLDNALLYVVNVTADAILTAASELMTLIAKKF